MANYIKKDTEFDIFVIKDLYFIVEKLLITLEKVDEFITDLWDNEVVSLGLDVFLE
jgi:hypothetical protein